MKFTCAAAALVSAPDAENDRPTWQQLAADIDAKGYAGGRFKFDRPIFEQVVTNFRRSPKYDGGSSGVVHWDFDHASEQDPSAGSRPSLGAPAQGWITELDIRDGARGAELWGLTRWLEPARSYVRDGRYQHASVTVLFDSVDPVSGQNVGALLTSCALTNTPFVEGMQRLAASKQAQSLVAKVVHVRLPSTMSRNSPQARALVAQLAKRLSTPSSPADLDAANDGAPATAEEQRLLQQTRDEISHRPAPTTLRLDATKETGRNRVERAIECMRRRVEGFSKLDWETQIERAGEALRLGIVAA